MKKLSMLSIMLFMLLSAVTINAQGKSTDFFVGKWDVLVEGAPGGDAKLRINLERNEGKLTGTISRDGTESTKITSVDEKENYVTVYYNSGGYDVYFDMSNIGKSKLKQNGAS
nr:hypothetical protein [uncultured Macellibacteroides sp.]